MEKIALYTRDWKLNITTWTLSVDFFGFDWPVLLIFERVLGAFKINVEG